MWFILSLSHALNPLNQYRAKRGEDGCENKEQRVAVKSVDHQCSTGVTAFVGTWSASGTSYTPGVEEGPASPTTEESAIVSISFPSIQS
jgi:hypothetical protein